MSAAPAAATDAGDRAWLLQRLHDALDALERDDETAWRRHVDALAGARTRSLVQGLSRLARELEQALGALPPPADGDGGLDDACARLDHVVAMTEQATHRTLDLIDHARALVARLQDGALDPAQAQLAAALRLDLQEMALAQSHQDLGGQIVRRVAGIVRGVHENLGALGLPPREPGAASPRGHGPAVAGLDRDAVDQDAADDLLSRLGL